MISFDIEKRPTYIELKKCLETLPLEFEKLIYIEKTI